MNTVKIEGLLHGLNTCFARRPENALKALAHYIVKLSRDYTAGLSFTEEGIKVVVERHGWPKLDAGPLANTKDLSQKIKTAGLQELWIEKNLKKESALEIENWLKNVEKEKKPVTLYRLLFLEISKFSQAWSTLATNFFTEEERLEAEGKPAFTLEKISPLASEVKGLLKAGEELDLFLSSAGISKTAPNFILIEPTGRVKVYLDKYPWKAYQSSKPEGWVLVDAKDERGAIAGIIEAVNHRIHWTTRSHAFKAVFYFGIQAIPILINERKNDLFAGRAIDFILAKEYGKNFTAFELRTGIEFLDAEKIGEIKTFPSVIITMLKDALLCDILEEEAKVGVKISPKKKEIFKNFETLDSEAAQKIGAKFGKEVPFSEDIMRIFKYDSESFYTRLIYALGFEASKESVKILVDQLQNNRRASHLRPEEASIERILGCIGDESCIPAIMAAYQKRQAPDYKWVHNEDDKEALLAIAKIRARSGGKSPELLAIAGGIMRGQPPYTTGGSREGTIAKEIARLLGGAAEGLPQNSDEPKKK